MNEIQTQPHLSVAKGIMPVSQVLKHRPVPWIWNCSRYLLDNHRDSAQPMAISSWCHELGDVSYCCFSLQVDSESSSESATGALRLRAAFCLSIIEGCMPNLMRSFWISSLFLAHSRSSPHAKAPVDHSSWPLFLLAAATALSIYLG